MKWETMQRSPWVSAKTLHASQTGREKLCEESVLNPFWWSSLRRRMNGGEGVPGPVKGLTAMLLWYLTDWLLSLLIDKLAGRTRRVWAHSFAVLPAGMDEALRSTKGRDE